MVAGKSKHRNDIEGLRGIAILLVLVFHISPASLPGGYIGVDVFFVISGFLITRIVWDSLQGGTFTFSGFYLNRIRRLFPAYICMIIGASIGVLLWGLPSEIKVFGMSALTSIWYVSNFYFLGVNDYFNAAMQMNPLLHTWSLSIEEQYYILLPMTLWLVHKTGLVKLTTVLTIFIVLSFAYSMWRVGHNESAAFYLIPSRIWQFSLGGILVFLTLPKFMNRLAVVIFLAGLAMVIVPAFVLGKSTIYPGISAVAPTLGTAFILWSGNRINAPVSWLINNLPLLYTGRISYSLYLWHWPIIVLYKYKITDYPVLKDKLIMLVICLIVAYFSWRFVEMPGKKISLKVHKRKFVAITSVLMLTLTGCTSFLYTSDGTRSRFDDGVLAVADYLEYDLKREAQGGTCFLTSNNSGTGEYRYDQCFGVDSDKPKILIVGDSFAAHFYTGLVRKHPDHFVAQLNSSGCRPVVGAVGKGRCVELMNRLFSEYLPNNQFDIVYFSGRWRTSEFQQLRQATELAVRNAGQVVVFGPTIEYTKSLPKILIEEKTDVLSKKITIKNSHYARLKKLDETMSVLENEPQVSYVSLLDTVCPDGMCRIEVENNVPMQFDYGHFTAEGAHWVLSRSVF